VAQHKQSIVTPFDTRIGCAVALLAVLFWQGCSDPGSHCASCGATAAPGSSASDSATPSAGQNAAGEPAGDKDGTADSTVVDAGEADVAEPKSDLSARCAQSSPSREPTCVDDSLAVFVAPSGSDSAEGSRAAPVASLERAITAAVAQRKYVIACEGDYAESLKIGAGIRLFGGFMCPSAEGAAAWSHKRGMLSRVTPPERGVALAVHSGAEKVEIEDVEFVAKPGEELGESSVAGFVTDSDDVVLRRVRLTAGAGQPGLSAPSAFFAFPSLAELRGTSGALGGASKTCTCPDGSVTVGGEASGPSASVGSVGQPATDPSSGKGGSALSSCSQGGNGSPGARGIASADAPRIISVGTLTETGFLGADGASAPSGRPGQGGGGGAGQPRGGGGGCGGCGGRGGAGGRAGGSSIALIALASFVTIDCGILTSSDGGSGGAGAPGQLGQSDFGAGGEGLGEACAGGPGGPGGNAGSGGGAAGGVSVALMYQGFAPTLVGGTQLQTGAPGAPGLGGNRGVNDGLAGVAQATLEMSTRGLDQN
jgi:hypothetical protein